MKTRKLVNLYQEKDGGNASNYYIDYAYYNKNKWGENEWTGESESCYLTENELYQIIKPYLIYESGKKH